MNSNTHPKLEKLKVSRIRSFEKKPLRLGNPNRFTRDTNIMKQEKGV